MDKIKLYSNNKNIISKATIENNFNYVGNSFDVLQHSTKLNFTNKITDIVIDKYGLLLKSNPTKYLKENNLIQIDRKQLNEFKEKFENDLSINTNDLRLTGFDYNLDIITEYPPKSYLTTIRTLPKYKQIIYPYIEGITFMNACKSFTFYDKIKQMTKDNIIIPQSHFNKNILRLEIGIKGKMKQTNNLKNIDTLKDIIQPDNYLKAIDEFQNIYNKIHKQPLIKFENMTIPNPSIMNTNDFALLYYINEVGMTEYLNQLSQEKDMGCITYRQWKIRKDKALQLWETYSSTDLNSNDLLDEMNNKVINRIKEMKDLAMVA